MKNTINAVLISLATLILVGCDNGASKEIGGGTNVDLSGNAYYQKLANNEEAQQGAYGELLHRGKVSDMTIVQGFDINPTIGGINIISAGTKRNVGTVVNLVCETRSNSWALTHNVYTDNGKGTRQAINFSIMNYRNGVTDIREADEYAEPYFSTANGDVDIYAALKGLVRLDPESTIAFTMEEDADDDTSVTIAWSPLFKVKDVIKGLKSVNLNKCIGAEPVEDAFMQFITNEDIKAGAKELKNQ